VLEDEVSMSYHKICGWDFFLFSLATSSALVAGDASGHGDSAGDSAGTLLRCYLIGSLKGLLLPLVLWGEP